MPTSSNGIIFGGQPYEIGGDIRIINFRDNSQYSFMDPAGGTCASGGGGADSAPEVQGLAVTPPAVSDPAFGGVVLALHAPTADGPGCRARFDSSIWRRIQGDLSGNSLVSVPKSVLPNYSEWDIATRDSVTSDVTILWPWQTDEQ